MSDIAIKIEHVSKEYRLGTIGGGTLRGDLQSWWAKMNHREDPNSLIGSAPNAYSGDRFLALDDVSFEVHKGEALGIIGHNGAGKSTLLKLLSRVTAPSSGKISYNGRIASMLEVGTGFHPELTGRENVYMNGAILGMTKEEIDKKFDQIVEFAEMEKFIDTPVKRYSSGMYVKLAFAVAAHLDSEILVMDEVLAVGDMKFQQKCLGKMGDVANSEGRTVLYVSHNMNTIRQLCTRCIVLEQGHLIFDGDVEQAIELYMSSARRELNTAIDLTKVSRDASYQKSPYQMTAFVFRNKNAPYIALGDRVDFLLSIRADSPVDNMCLRTMVYFGDDTPVGMASTVRGVITLKPGVNDIRGEINTSLLAPGSYRLKLALYFVNEYGTEQLCDVVDDTAYFIVEEGNSVNNMTWLHRWWGHIRLQDIEISNISN
ncbi:MAG: polysaccharide ABC transporter ATP-binding protein [Faecousia sp.]